MPSTAAGTTRAFVPDAKGGHSSGVLYAYAERCDMHMLRGAMQVRARATEATRGAHSARATAGAQLPSAQHPRRVVGYAHHAGPKAKNEPFGSAEPQGRSKAVVPSHLGHIVCEDLCPPT
eukprot:155455-Chlamydomonas_euryale.AAC.1